MAYESYSEFVAKVCAANPNLHGQPSERDHQAAINDPASSIWTRMEHRTMRRYFHAIMDFTPVDDERPVYEVRILNAWRDSGGAIVRPGIGKDGKPGRGVTLGGLFDDPRRITGVVDRVIGANGYRLMQHFATLVAEGILRKVPLDRV